MARRLKIAHIITRLELGGAQQNTLYCCANHDRKKYDVLLISGTGGYLDPEARKIKDCRTYFLPELKHPLRPWWDLIAFFKIASILRNEKVNLVHTHSSKAGILGRWAAKWAKVPHLVHTVHGWGFFPGQFFITRLLYRLLERWTGPVTDRLIAVSEDNQKDGLAAHVGVEKQYRVIHSGIDPRQFVLAPAKVSKLRGKWGLGKRPCVLILSNFKKQKSPLDVVKVAEALKAKRPDALFLWAGDGSDRAKVEQEIGERGLSDNFKLLGWREDVAELLGVSEVLLLTSLHEGLPRVVLQAMAARKPVVATAVNGTPEAVKNGVTGFLHKPHETKAMADSLFKILQSKALARKMGQAGR
ncbi:MAG TPA: glycosyltransferase family 4 protein, partial [bacterium]